MASKVPELRLHGIQALRAIAAIIVTVFHAHLYLPDDQPRHIYLFGFGEAGVPIFFVISGLIMVITTSDDARYRPLEFFRRRLIRIFPIYWVFVALYLLGAVLIGKHYNLSQQDLVGAILLVPGKAGGVIGSGWTLPFELYFYFAFGITRILPLDRAVPALSALFIVLIGIGAATHPANDWLKEVTNPIQLEFLAGAWIGWLAARGKLPVRLGPLLVAVAVALFAIGIGLGYRRIPLTISWGVPSAILVLGVVSWEAGNRAGRVVRALGRLGNSSYVLYLAHMLITAIAIFAMRRIWGGVPPAPITVSLCITVLAIGLSHLAHLGIEQPLQRWLSPRRNARPVARPLPN